MQIAVVEVKDVHVAMNALRSLIIRVRYSIRPVRTPGEGSGPAPRDHQVVCVLWHAPHEDDACEIVPPCYPVHKTIEVLCHNRSGTGVVHKERTLRASGCIEERQWLSCWRRSPRRYIDSRPDGSCWWPGSWGGGWPSPRPSTRHGPTSSPACGRCSGPAAPLRSTWYFRRRRRIRARVADHVDFGYPLLGSLQGGRGNWLPAPRPWASSVLVPTVFIPMGRLSEWPWMRP